MSDELLDASFSREGTYQKESFAAVAAIRNIANEKIKAIRTGRALLLFLAFFNLIYTLIINFINLDIHSNDIININVFYSSMVIFTIYLLLAIFAKQHSRIVFIIAALLYSLTTLLTLITDFDSIGFGLIIKIMFIYYFVKAIPAATILKIKMTELQVLGVPTSWLEAAKNLKELPSTRTL